MKWRVTQVMTPKQILLALPLLCLAAFANGQRTNYSIGLNSGIFRYTGDHSFKVTAINLAPTLSTRLEGTPGRDPGFSYEISANAQRITKSKFIFGLELAWQSMQTKAAINGVIPTIYSSYFATTTGKSKLTSQFIAVTPFAGYRLLDKKVKVDVITGLEMAGCINRKEYIEAINPINGETISGAGEVATRSDLRARLQLNTSIGRFGLTTGYSAGLTDFYREDIILTARSSFIRLGLNYRLH